MYGERRNVYRILVAKAEGRYHLKNLGITGRIILKCTIKHGRVSTGLISPKTEEMARFLLTISNFQFS